MYICINFIFSFKSVLVTIFTFFLKSVHKLSNFVDIRDQFLPLRNDFCKNAKTKIFVPTVIFSIQFFPATRRQVVHFKITETRLPTPPFLPTPPSDVLYKRTPETNYKRKVTRQTSWVVRWATGTNVVKQCTAVRKTIFCTKQTRACSQGKTKVSCNRHDKPIK